MVAISPFRALRYDVGCAGPLDTLLSPPYDVITPDQQEQLYRASPHNIVRLILGKQSAADTSHDNRYTRARSDFEAWRAQRILVQDPHPAIYVLEQTFHDQGITRSRLGFIALFRLDDAAGPAVYRHEATLSAPKADRTKLLEAIPANLEPIFCIFPDEDGIVQRLLEGVTRRTPPTAGATLGSEAVWCWGVTDSETIRQVAQHLAPVAVLIADGHHRFEVAYANRSRYPVLMSYFVSMADPSLVVRPIHRLVQAGGAGVLPALQALCVMEPATPRLVPQRSHGTTDLDSLLQWLQSQTTPGCFGFHDGRQGYRVTVKPSSLQRWLQAPTVAKPLAGLDVALLHGFLLPQAGANDAAVHYTADAARVLSEVSGAATQSAWWLRGIPLSQVYALASQGLVLPPKSTYFYPKVPSGLAMNLLA